MRTKAYTKIALCFAFSLFIAQSTFANANPKTLARQALSENAEESVRAIAKLRTMGQAGLDVLFEVYEVEIRALGAGTAVTQSESLQRLSHALDTVSQQRNSYASRLYWYTDFDKAKEAARVSGKPILSLRLLGNLNEEFSCANSRFFRTVLYANKTVADVLRDRFVLHWKSVRPAPRVTIDYGDGRKIERTLTGNSIHYILTSDGEVLDSLPGLYGPQAFLRGIEQAETINKQIAGKNEAARTTILNRYHMDHVAAIGKQWTADAVKLGVKIPDSIVRDEASGQSFDARVAARTAMSKMVSEISIIRAITYDVTVMQDNTDEAVWTKIAGLHSDDARLDQSSIALVRRQNSSEKGVATSDEQLSRIVANFERYLAFDTVRNEYTMHSTLHAWLSTGMRSDDVESLNVRVYKDLFLTPSSDPWLGLYSPDTYTALENGGISR
jgi:Asp-tRNA(Asn)/Glu-tRNA(Gln) amidotransferase C subunit